MERQVKMPTNNTSQITEDEINQLKKYRDEVNVFLNGVKVTRKDSLYTPEALRAVREDEKLTYWRKARSLLNWPKRRFIRRIIGPFWSSEQQNIEEAWREIETATEDRNRNWIELHEGRLHPTFAASDGFVKLSESLDYIIGKLAEQTGGDKGRKRKPNALKTRPEYSLPLPMTKWAYILGVSPNTLRKMRKQKKYHFKNKSERRWTLPIHEMPAEYLEKYRQHIPQRPA
ncbi:hypothetical protein MUP77_17815 [Candidatus Bathyarchaeota archaeon]|nr:hypothetical protein [Candidatus Bathyarchaeota archaeon]